MLEKFLGLRIKGRCFEQETDLKFFSGDNQRVSLVFGRNGSGKSTVSRTFAQLAKDGQRYDNMETVDILDRDHPEAASTILTPASLKDKIKVFNEDYVQKKIVLKGGQTANGLETIVMFGDQGPIDTQIDQETEKETRLNGEIKVCKDLKADLERGDNPMSPDVIKERIIEDILKNKKLNGWAYREGKILGWGKAQSTDEDTIDEIMCRAGEDAPEVNLDTFNQKLATLEQSRRYKDLVLAPINIGKDLDFNEDALLALLNTHVENPELNERDKRIMAVIAEFGQPWMQQAESYINKVDTTHCPCCQRTLDSDAKTYATESIESALKAALTNDVENYKADLSKFVVPSTPHIDLDNYAKIAPEIVQLTKRHLVDFADRCDKYKQDVANRMLNIHGTPQFKSRNLTEIKEKLIRDFEDLKKCREVFEAAKQEIDKLKSELQELNYKIAKNEIKEEYALFVKQKNVASDNTRRLMDLEHQLQVCQQEIAKLQAQKKSIKIARDRINQALKYIFLSDNRIQIEVEGDVYKIKTNGNPVAPQDVSVGERNALALCYFFSDMLEQSEEKKAYDTERLVILDDPVSSFDHENKMGVLSYIMFEIENLTCTLKEENRKKIRPETRVICMVHELYTYFALANAIQSHDDKAPEPKIGLKLFSLDCRKANLVSFPWKLDKINEYRENFNDIMAYAELKDPAPDIHVGNQTRRLLEAFSTFVFRQGIEYLFYTEDIIKDAHKADFHRYYKEVFSRFVVNDESHLQGRIRSLTNGNCLLPFIHQDAQQRAVRDAICLIYLIMPEHVLSLFESKSIADEKKVVIEKWIQKIREDAPVKIVGASAA